MKRLLIILFKATFLFVFIFCSILYLFHLAITNFYEDVSIKLRFDRPTILLPDDNYVETFSGYDYFLDKENQTIRLFQETEYQFTSKLKEHSHLNLIVELEQEIESKYYDLKTTIVRQSDSVYRLVKTVSLKKNDIKDSFRTYNFQILRNVPNTSDIGCKILLDNLSKNAYQINSENVITIATPVENSSEIKVSFELKIDCGKSNRFIIYQLLSKLI